MKSMKGRLSKAGKWWKSLDQECESSANKTAAQAAQEFEEIHQDYLVLRDARELGRRQTSTESNGSSEFEGAIRYIRKKFIPAETRSLDLSETEGSTDPKLLSLCQTVSDQPKKGLSRQTTINKWDTKQLNQ